MIEDINSFKPWRIILSMGKPKLPIHDISEAEFGKFKGQYLDKVILDEEAIKKIGNLFRIGSDAIVEIICDEAHIHPYSCLRYKSPEAGIVERLLNEVNHYRRKLKNIHKESDIS